MGRKTKEGANQEGINGKDGVEKEEKRRKIKAYKGKAKRKYKGNRRERKWMDINKRRMN